VQQPVVRWTVEIPPLYYYYTAFYLIIEVDGNGFFWKWRDTLQGVGVFFAQSAKNTPTKLLFHGKSQKP
jgi:hypothetical protein